MILLASADPVMADVIKKIGLIAFKATTTAVVRQKADREPSSARSTYDRTDGVEYTFDARRIPGRCEPRTARGSVAVSGCAADEAPNSTEPSGGHRGV